MDQDREAAVLRIGELSRRVGVSEHLLRAWESRYGLLKPERSSGGYRLYSAADQSRVRRMQVHLAGGLAAAEAAQTAIAEEQRGVIGDPSNAVAWSAPAGQADLAGAADALRQALEQLDEPAAQNVLDRLLADFTVETVLRDVVLPYLRELGQRWADGTISIAQEHFASHVVRGRLTSLSRGWGNGRGPQVLLACPSEEQHDLPLMIFGIVLHRAGWRVEYLGANCPVPEVIQVTSQMLPNLVVLSATTGQRLAGVVAELTTLADLAPLMLAGPGATQGLADSVGARLVTDDPVTAAERLAGTWG